MEKPSRVWNFKMGKAYFNIRCSTVKNPSRSTVPHGFGSRRCVIVFLLITAAINVSFASLTVSVDNFNVGVNATFSCVFEGALRQLIWSKTGSGGEAPNPQFILKYLDGLPVSYGASVDRTHYKFDKTSHDLKVLDVTLDDDGRYWCEVRAAGFDDAENSTLASIIVQTAAETTNIAYKGTPYTDGKSIEVDAGEQTFTCISTGIKPAATFTWTPSTLSGTTTSVASKVDSRLFDSSSNVTVDIGSSLSFKQLKCKASNTDDESLDVEINVNLTLNEPTTMKPTTTSKPAIETTTATGLSIGIIIGIVVGSLCVVVITVGVGIAILKYNSKNGVTPDSNQSKKGKKKEAIEEEHV